MNKEFNIKKTGFKTPKDYFDRVEDDVLTALKTAQLKEEAKTSGLAIPEHYFDDVEDRVLERLNPSSAKVIKLQTRRWVYAAASIAAILVLYFTVFNNKGSISFDTLETELVESYIIEQNIDTYELASLLNDDDLEAMNETIFEPEFSEEQLEEYILDHIELESIIDQ